MDNLDLLHYIEQARKSGMGDEQIRQGLSQSGWAETDVNEALMNVPAVSSPAVKPKALMSKSLAVIFIVAALAVAGYFASAYYFTNYQNLPVWPFEGEAVAPVPVFTPRPAVKDPTADWKIYRNEEYGFEFGYPGDWRTGDPGLIVPYLNTVGLYGPTGGVTMVSVFSNENNLSLKDWLNQFDKNLPPEGDGTSVPPVEKTEDAELNGIPALKTIIDESGTMSRSFYLKKDKTVINIYQYAINSPTLNIYDQILSTFKFIK